MPERRSALVRLPELGRWTYGGYPYGVEPLVLPPAGAAADDAHPPVPHELARAETLLTRLEADARETPAGPARAGGVDLAWFRWITGHQICFVLWRLLAEVEPTGPHPLTADQVRTARTCLDAYSAMLLYTGSCTREVYLAHVRPSMARQHPSFSGSWAPDYHAVRQLLPGRAGPLAHVEDVAGALWENQRVHDAVAAWLVHDGPSLLRQAQLGRVEPELSRLLYDAYFVTARQPVAGWDIAAQLLRRALAVAADLRENALYRPEDERAARPDVWWDGATVAGLVVAAARCAVGPVAARACQLTTR